ncbi:lysosomal L-cystine transporter [Aspergillus steynii IBT 23096]|uniref:Lysosomal L-cystine transporter n=1 Tax=Aspergillus steynii IBT 23096 TaxID=1392250 RepID=A0A2I2GH18_9EURO|nr:lysosomal L-cystine transporter [Aspergillus steynii IBT 23096]PLB52178.1 lysosomal L-cystine transporter [Aspergillus steynii IBT 23096]
MSPIVTISSIVGWTYVFLWSISFYPQVLTNLSRKSSSGLSIEFTWLNALGLTAYSVFNAVLLFSPVVRAQYASRLPGNPTPPVHFSDLVYAAHGAGLCLVLLSQAQWPHLWGFRGSKAALSLSTIGVFWGCIAIIFAGIGSVLLGLSQRWEWLDVVYTIGNIKLFLTVVKYTPQVIHNYRRQSTEGFSIYAILLDFTGGLLSVVQLLLDLGEQGNWSQMSSGNGAKFALGNVTMLFDITFIVQHYILYRHRSKGKAAREERAPSEEDPLLGNQEA